MIFSDRCLKQQDVWAEAALSFKTVLITATGSLELALIK